MDGGQEVRWSSGQWSVVNVSMRPVRLQRPQAPDQERTGEWAVVRRSGGQVVSGQWSMCRCVQFAYNDHKHQIRSELVSGRWSGGQVVKWSVVSGQRVNASSSLQRPQAPDQERTGEWAVVRRSGGQVVSGQWSVVNVSMRPVRLQRPQAPD